MRFTCALHVAGATLLLTSVSALAAPAMIPADGSCKQPIAISAKDDAALRDAFNKAHGSVRLVFLVDPICPTCLRGLKDIDAAVLSSHKSDASLKTFVIHTPVLGATETDTANTCSIVHNEYVTHYWDPNQELGSLFASALGMMKDGHEIYAWDVWLIYGPNAVWSGNTPPKADFMMHQLPDLVGRDGFPFLKASVFGEEVEKQLHAVKHEPAVKSSP